MEDKNPADDEGWTPLHIASIEGYLDMVKYISQDLEDENPADNEGDTPLDIAAQKGYLEVFNYCKSLER